MSRETLRQFPLALLRIVVGWHFLYEGLTKLLNPGWTSAGYLKSSTGLFAGFFQWLASQEELIGLVDILNVWGLLAIGLALMLGVFVRPAAAGGMVLLASYYLAYPPLFSPGAGGVAEGNYLIVNKNLVELCALCVVAAFPAMRWGLGILLGSSPRPAGAGAEAVPKLDTPVPAGFQHSNRREMVAALAGIPFLGAFAFSVLKKHGWKSFEEMQLTRASGAPDAVSGATMRRFEFSTLKDLQGHMPRARIKDLELSRMILGGNLIGGWAHARDLIYVSKLVKAYHHRDKIFETFHIAEQCGVNTVLTNPLLCGMINDYWRHGGKIQFISDCGGQNVLEMIQKSIDNGAAACYIQGGVADDLVAKGDFTTMSRGLELIRRNGLPAGIGAHKLETVKASVERGLIPDFWMKTLHCHDYWSVQPSPEHDNIWCYDPAETVAFMREREEPWIAFKILAAGALEPEPGFRYAFENGADFICVGMYDFQIVDDVNLCCRVLGGDLARNRQWRA
jgi:uncharacterized membrane protein YphA (DoxX/SURF4 family)